MKSLSQRILWAAMVGALGLGCAAAPPAREAAFTVTQEHFESSGVKILTDVYRPRSAGSHPPILVLHGAGGMLFDGPAMSRVAGDLARAGYTVYQVHYFNRTHTWFARQAVLLRLFPTWRGTVHDAVEWVRARHPEAPTVGIYGYSLGAFAAIEEARRNPAVGVVVEQAGGFWNAQPEGPTRQPLPPMLLIHGLDDQRVPFARYTTPLMNFLRAHRDPFETRFFPGEGHILRPPAQAEVRASAVAFFRRHLEVPPK